MALRKEIKILLVDDDDLSRRMLGLLLSENGYNYDTATNGIEAVTSVQSNTYDIVLMDLQMPLMDGFEATLKIREWEVNDNHTPIVALSAMLLDNEIQKCLKVGMDTCIEKPFDTETLFKLIDSYGGQSEKSASTDEPQNFEDSNKLMMLDIQDALPRFSHDVDVYQDFLNEFINELPYRMNQFRDIFLSGDYISLADKAHNLKGISSSMGAKQLSHLTHKLDQESQKEDQFLVQKTLEEIEKHILTLRKDAGKILSDFRGK